MPVLDTEVLFALNPRDQKHESAVKTLSELREQGSGIYVPDTALLEFQIVLRTINKEPASIKASLLALRMVVEVIRGEEIKTIGSYLLAKQCEIEVNHGLTYFDSLIAASALSLDSQIVSDDHAFDRVTGIQRIPLK